MVFNRRGCAPAHPAGCGKLTGRAGARPLRQHIILEIAALGSTRNLINECCHMCQNSSILAIFCKKIADQVRNDGLEYDDWIIIKYL